MEGLPWGGSEELWCGAAMVLLERGHELSFNCRKWPRPAEPLQQLIRSGAVPQFRGRRRLGRGLRRALVSMRLVRQRYHQWLKTSRPDLVVISFSCHTDDPQISNSCRELGIRYVILLQAASPYQWIDARSLAEFQTAYAHAERCYFVSDENRQIVESNLAIGLSHSEIVDNPFNVKPSAAPPWPASEPLWHLAYVARIHFISKSQDVLLRILRQTKWRTRSLKVTFWGSDNGFLTRFRQLIDLYNLHEQVAYGGFATDIEALWAKHHGLLLPSRSEGNPLSLIEAMMCGRMVITTKVGRAAELIDDNYSGFLAPAATVELVDDALERAWQRRHEWQAMGQRAALAIRQRHSLRPCAEFAERILGLATQKAAARRLAA
jgi:glycosyltransferase involved in cell wall biosynthesis